MEYAEIKRPRLEMGPESLMRPSSHRPPMPLGGAEDMAKVSSHNKIPQIILTVWSILQQDGQQANDK